MTKELVWSRVDLSYILEGRKVKPQLITGAADAVAQEAKAQLSVIATRIQSGALSLEEGYSEAKRLSKIMTVAEKALARGGWDQMRPADYTKAEKTVLELWEGRGDPFPNGGLRRVFEDASSGFFGEDLDKRGFNYWMQRPANQGHSIYENERVEIHRESGYVFATRLLAAGDSCPTCIEEGDKKVPINEVVEISESECSSACRCVIIFDMD